MADYVLVHHGIKGMKWGVRRFQKKDGSLTSAGKKRYNVDEHKTLTSAPSHVTTKAGRDIELSSVPSPRITSFLAAHNKAVRSTAENTSNYVIKVDGKRIGDLELYKESKDSLNVVWLGVDNSERGNGYATAAMLGAIEVARRSGCKQVTLEVPGDSPDARHIYEKLGFVAQEVISDKDDIWGGLTSMKLELDDNGIVVRHAARFRGNIEAADQILVHHGIKGQKWGVKNGPPYPLGSDQKSFAEKRLTKSSKRKEDSSFGRSNVGGSKNSRPSGSAPNRFWTDERKATAKRIATAAAVTTGIALAVYGGYKLSQMTDHELFVGKNMVENTLSNIGSTPIPRVGKSTDQVDRGMVSRINSHNSGEAAEANCAHTSVAYILNSVFGQNVRAKVMYGVDELSGLQQNGRNWKCFYAIFDGIKRTHVSEDDPMSTTIDKIRPGSTGILYVKGTWFLSGHYLAYEKSSSSDVTIIDPQQRDGFRQVVSRKDAAFRDILDTWRVSEVLDLSDASLSDSASDVLQYFVE